MTELYEMLLSAKEAEAEARALMENDMGPEPSCRFSFGDVVCYRREPLDGCENLRAPSLLQKAWAGYCKAEALARRYAVETDSAECIALLAQVLLDIHIHPNSGYRQDTPELWESQYLWLKLYYRTRDEGYMEKARLCDGIRNAFAVIVKGSERNEA